MTTTWENVAANLHKIQSQGMKIVILRVDSLSMDLWDEVIVSFLHLLAEHGVNVHNQRVPSDQLQPDAFPYPTDRKILIAFSDCVGNAWNNGDIPALLNDWGEHIPVLLVHMLPERLWEQTALRGSSFSHAQGVNGYLNNHHLKIKKRRRFQETSNTPLPIASFDPLYLSRWIQMICGESSTIATVTYQPPKEQIGHSHSAKTYLNLFLANSSRFAKRLAQLFAAAPLTVATMKLIQESMLPESNEAHLAEFFLGGLIDQTGDIFDFKPDIRDLLLDTCLVPEIVAVQRHVGINIDTFLAQPEQLTEATPFVEFICMTLERLGGKHTQAAINLKKNR